MQLVDVDVTCRTADCENQSFTIRVTAPVENQLFVCGACGQQITEIQSVESKE